MSKRAVRLTALLTVGLLASACSAQTSDDTQGARSATDAFLRALADGRTAEALAFSTATSDDLACAEMAQDVDRARSIAAPSVDFVAVQGDTATSDVSYSAPEPVSTTLDLEKRDGDWAVALPDEWRLELAFDGPTIADVTVDDTCVIPASDASVGAAWPGRYRIAVTDPTGVLQRTESFLIEVPGSGVTGYDGDPSAMAAVPDDALDALRAEAAPLLAIERERCLAAAPCPAGLRGVSADVPPSASSLTIERLWTDDGRSWRFETPQDLAPSFRGTLSRDSQGTLAVAIDES